MIAIEEADEDEKSRIDAGRDGRLYTFFTTLVSTECPLCLSHLFRFPWLSWPRSADNMQGERERVHHNLAHAAQ